MTQVGNVPEINVVKRHLSELKTIGWINAWELPYENILTTINAAVFFLTPTKEEYLDKIWEALAKYQTLVYRLNNTKLSELEWKVEFKKS